jgi:glycosyltransferase involved in cell wall biosynthesis
MKKVIIFQRITAGYRIPFYTQLKHILDSHGIELNVFYGQPSKFELYDEVPEFNCGKRVANKYLYFGRRFLIWQPFFKYLRNADLVILQQGNVLISNNAIMLLRHIFSYKVAYWGHGRNFQTVNKNSLSEHLKKLNSTHVNRWFAYNDLSKKVIMNFGYPEEKITSVNNSIDTKENMALLDGITKHELREIRLEYSINENSHVGIFCGRLYRAQEIDFLIRAVEMVKKKIKNFHFFIIGDGVESLAVKTFADKNMDWFHWVGARYGRDKALFFSMADFQLMPGAVGLHVVESFALLTPLITTDSDRHGPEIAYLDSGNNGLITKNTIDSYVNDIISVIEDVHYYRRLVEGCRKARKYYTLENMVTRFADGIRKELC